MGEHVKVFSRVAGMQGERARSSVLCDFVDRFLGVAEMRSTK